MIQQSLDYAIGPAPQGGDRNRGSEILAVDGVIFGISWSMVLLRMFTRSWVTRNVGWDDATIVLAAMTNSVGLGFYVSMVLYGLGRHKYYLSNYDFKEFLKYDYLDWIQTFITLAISKISVCLLLLRLSKFSKLKTILYILIAFITTTHLPLLLLIIVQCQPVEKDWDTALDGRCFSKDEVAKILIAQGFFSILTDFIGAAFPVLLLWNVKIKMRNKVAIWFLMSFGCITAITCIIRTSLTYHIKSKDLSWDGVGISIAKCLEVNFGIIAACLPIMKPLYTYLHSVYTGSPVDLRKGSNQTYTTNSRSPWLRLRSSITAKSSKPTKHIGSAAADAQNRSNTIERQYTWRKHVPNLTFPKSSKARQGGEMTTNESIGLPIQGITKTTDLSVERGSLPRHSKGSFNGEVGLEELI